MSISEEALIRRGHTFCSGLSRVFTVLCRVGGVPARCLLCYRPNGTGHAMNEAYAEGKWRFFDPTFSLFVRDESGDVASAVVIDKDSALAARIGEHYRYWQSPLMATAEGREYDYGSLFWAVTISNYTMADSNRFFPEEMKG